MKSGDSMLHYRVGDLIGVGGMGEVHQATDTRLGREVAIKLLPENFSDDTDRRQRFEREARSLAALQHPGIATIHGLEEQDGRLFLVMELVRGDDLKETLERGALPTEKAVDFAVQIAEGLEEAHARGIVHRDLKPANVKITPEGRVKILDFGLARAMTEETGTGDPSESPTMTADMTRDGSILGTAAYMSPEQARGYEVDARADIWAFGCLLFEMLSGKAPFAGETTSDILASVLRSDPDWSELPGGLPRGLTRLLRRCLTKDQSQRLHAVADARIELAELDDTEPAPQVQRERPRRRSFAWLALLGWLAAAAAVFFLLKGDSPETDAPVRIDTLTYSTRDWAPDASQDGDMVAFVSDRDGVQRIWLKQVASGGEAPLTEGIDSSPRFSPDGSQILFVRETGSSRHLYRTNVVGSQLRRVVENAIEGDWSPDGTSVAFLRTFPEDLDNIIEIGIVDLGSGSERILNQVAQRLCYGIRWSPDGRRLVINQTSLTGNAAVASILSFVDVATGEMEDLAPTSWTGPFTAVEWLGDGDAFIFGQAADVITHVSGMPSLLMTYEVDARTITPLLWTQLRHPRGSWGSSTIAMLEGGDLILDEQTAFAHLQTYDLDDEFPGAPVTVTQGIGIDRQPVYSPDGTRILFSSNRSGNVDLWLQDIATGRLSQLTDDPDGDWDPAFTPDGTEVIWTSERSGNMEIWMSNLDGSGSRQLTRDGIDAENATMTADGEWVVYASGHDEKRGIWKIRPDGSDAQFLADGPYLIPDVSPDGRHAVFMSVRNLDYVINAVEIETGRMLPFEIVLPQNQNSENIVQGRARWSPDGDSILYVGLDESRISGVFRQTFDPEAKAPVRPPEKVAGFDPLFTTESHNISPDGRTLIISALHEQRILKRASGVELDKWMK